MTLSVDFNLLVSLNSLIGWIAGPLFSWKG